MASNIRYVRVHIVLATRTSSWCKPELKFTQEKCDMNLILATRVVHFQICKEVHEALISEVKLVMGEKD